MADGAIYDSDAKTKLIKVAKIDTVNFEVPSSVIEIVGGSFLDSAFNPCASHIKKVTFGAESRLTTIGNYLFSSTALSSIDMSNCVSLTSLSEGIFYDCQDLVYVKLPNKLQTINTGAFSYCISLPSLDIPDSVTKIENWDSKVSGVFADTVSLKTLTITEKSQLTTLGSHAFIRSGLQSIILPATLTQIMSSPFLDSCIETIEIRTGNPKFKSDGHVITQGNVIITCAPRYSGSYEIPANAQFNQQTFRGSYISTFTFAANMNYQFSMYCFSHTKIKTISLPANVETISDYCFAVSAIESIILPKNLKKLNRYAFYECENLTEIILPEGLLTIGDLVFKDNFKLKHIEIPSTIQIYGEGVFANCNSDIEIVFKNKNTFKPDVNDATLIIFDQKVVEYIGKDPNHEVLFPSFCSTVGHSLFLNKSLKKVTFASPTTTNAFNEISFKNSTIQEITFPSGLTSIGSNCFDNCTLLTNVVIDGTFTSISISCFNNCESLNSLTLISTGITIIERHAFYNTKKLKYIDFSKMAQLDSIGYCAFQLSGLQIFNMPHSVTQIGDNAFRESSVTEFYGCADITLLSNYLLFEATQLEHVEIGSKVKTIGMHCFEGCIKLQNITISPETEVIDMYSFSRCDLLSYITIPKNSKLNSIRPFAFSGSFNFRYFDIKADTFSFDNRCLMDKSKTKIIYYIQYSRAKSFIVPGTVKIIDMYAFHYCVFLREIIIPDGVIEVIGVNAFEGCIHLKRLVLPKSLKTIGADAFKDCRSLGCGSVTIKENLIPQAIAAKINESALEKNCINNDDYVQYGRYTCQNNNYRSFNHLIFFFCQIFLVS